MDGPLRRKEEESNVSGTPDDKTLMRPLPPLPSAPVARAVAAAATGSVPTTAAARPILGGNTVVRNDVPPQLASQAAGIAQLGVHGGPAGGHPAIPGAQPPTHTQSPLAWVAGGVLFVMIVGAGALYGPKLLAGHGAPTEGGAASASRVDTSAPAPAPLANAVPRFEATESTGGCRRESSQTIDSTQRDQLLLEAIKAFENGQHPRAHAKLKEYTQEACDLATLDALTQMDRILTQQNKDR